MGWMGILKVARGEGQGGSWWGNGGFSRNLLL